MTVLMKIMNKQTRIKITLMIDGHGKKFSFKLSEGRFYPIGRDSNWLPVVHSTVSKVHLNLTIVSGRLLIEDNDSTNSSSLNGTRLEKITQVFPGDEVKFGDCYIHFISISGPTPGLQDQKGTDSKKTTVTSEKKTYPSQKSFKLEDFFSDPTQLLEMFKLAVTNPREFFDEYEFSGDVGFSILVITLCNIIGLIISMPGSMENFRVSEAIIVLLAAIGLKLFLSVLLHLFRGYLQTSAKFENFIRFFAVTGVIGLPIGLFSVIHIGISVLVSLVFVIWFIYGIITTFQITGLRYFSLHAAVFLIMSVVIGGIFGFENFTKKLSGSFTADSTPGLRNTGSILERLDEMAKTREMLPIAPGAPAPPGGNPWNNEVEDSEYRNNSEKLIQNPPDAQICAEIQATYTSLMKETFLKDGKEGRDKVIGEIRKSLLNVKKQIRSMGGEDAVNQLARGGSDREAVYKTVIRQNHCMEEFLNKLR